MLFRILDIAFRGLINKSVVVYLDDIIVYSKSQEDHVPHLKAIFERHRRYGISLNPKKIIFAIGGEDFARFCNLSRGDNYRPRKD